MACSSGWRTRLSSPGLTASGPSNGRDFTRKLWRNPMIALTLRRTAAALALALACALPSAAQQPAQPTPAALATAKELLQVKGATNMFDPLIPGVIESAKNALVPTNPQLFKELNEVAALLRTRFAARRNEIIDEIARLYAQRFTEAEMKEVIAFYKSPVGKKFVTEEPVVIDQGLARTQAWTNKLSDDVLTGFRAEMKKKGHDL